MIEKDAVCGLCQPFEVFVPWRMGVFVPRARADGAGPDARTWFPQHRITDLAASAITLLAVDRTCPRDGTEVSNCRFRLTGNIGKMTSIRASRGYIPPGVHRA